MAASTVHTRSDGLWDVHSNNRPAAVHARSSTVSATQGVEHDSGAPVSAHVRTVHCSDTDASTAPEGLNARHAIGSSSSPRMAATLTPETASHSSTAPSRPPDASRQPSTLKATAVTAPLWPTVALGYCSTLDTAHCRIVASSLADTTRWPSTENATPRTAPPWPCSVAKGLDVARSHTRTAASWQPVARNRPSAQKVTQCTGEPAWLSTISVCS